MVLGKGITTVLAAALLSLGYADVTLAQAKSISASFRDVAAKAGTSSYVGTAPGTHEPEVDEVTYPGSFNLDYRDGWTVVRKSDGAVIKFQLYDRSDMDREWNSSQALNNTQLTTLCQAYRDSAGFSGTVGIDAVDELHDETPMCFDVQVSPRISGVGFHKNHGSFFEISHTTGRLVAMELYDVPSAPPSVAPTVTSSQAFATVVYYIATTWGISTFADIDPPRLNIWKPVAEIPANSPQNFLTSAHATMASQNQGLLIHDFYFEGRDTFFSGGGVYIPRFAAFVDAQTGDLLAVYEYMPFGGGGKAKKSALTPDLGLGALHLTDLSLGKGIALKAANLTSASTASRAAQGRRVLIKRGKLAMLVRIDPSTGQVWADKDRNRRAQLDNKSLLAYRKLLGERTAKKPHLPAGQRATKMRPTDSSARAHWPRRRESTVSIEGGRSQQGSRRLASRANGFSLNLRMPLSSDLAFE